MLNDSLKMPKESRDAETGQHLLNIKNHLEGKHVLQEMWYPK